jgi:hypothetical protein
VFALDRAGALPDSVGVLWTTTTRRFHASPATKLIVWSPIRKIMKRRDVLVTTAAIAFAGCLGGETADGGEGTTTESTREGTKTDTGDTPKATTTSTEAGATSTETEGEPVETTQVDTETDTGTETAGGTTTSGGTAAPGASLTVADRKFTVQDRDASPSNEASVTVEQGGSHIVVTGTITAKNGCQTAVLDRVRAKEAKLAITVATERGADADAMCSQALVGISYRATFDVEGTAKSVSVIHRGVDGRSEVATAEPDS